MDYLLTTAIFLTCTCYILRKPKLGVDLGFLTIKQMNKNMVVSNVIAQPIAKNYYPF